jgi:hypothetical protein
VITGLGRGEVGGEQAEDEPRGPLQDQVGGWRVAKPGADLAAGDLDHRGTPAGVQLDRERRAVRLAVVQELRDREGEPVAAELVVVGGLGHVPDPPRAEGLERRLEPGAGLGQMEQRRRYRGCGVLAPDQSRGLELAETVGEQVGGDTGQPVLQVGVPARALQKKLPDHQQGPPVADHVQGLGDRTVLAIAAHATSIADTCLTSKSYQLTFSSQ